MEIKMAEIFFSRMDPVKQMKIKITRSQALFTVYNVEENKQENFEKKDRIERGHPYITVSLHCRLYRLSLE